MTVVTNTCRKSPAACGDILGHRARHTGSGAAFPSPTPLGPASQPQQQHLSSNLKASGQPRLRGLPWREVSVLQSKVPKPSAPICHLRIPLGTPPGKARGKIYMRQGRLTVDSWHLSPKLSNSEDAQSPGRFIPRVKLKEHEIVLV